MYGYLRWTCGTSGLACGEIRIEVWMRLTGAQQVWINVRIFGVGGTVSAKRTSERRSHNVVAGFIFTGIGLAIRALRQRRNYWPGCGTGFF